MFFKHLAHARGVEIPAPERLRLEQDVADPALKFLPEPVNEGHRESLFGSIDSKARHAKPFRELPERVLCLPHAKFPARRERSRPFYKFVVKKGAPNLERGGHAHPVHFRQHISSQVSFCVEVLHPAEVIICGRSVVIVAE